MKRTTRAAAVALALTLTGAATAHSETLALEAGPMDAATEHALNRGLALYEVGDYREAALAFSAGFAQQRHRNLLFAWAQAERKLGACDQARALYERFLLSEPPEREAQLARAASEACVPTSPVAPSEAPMEPEAEPEREAEQPQPPVVVARRPEVEPGSAIGDRSAASAANLTLRAEAPPRLSWYRDGVGAAALALGATSIAAGVGSYALSERQLEASRSADNHGAYRAARRDALRYRHAALGFGAAGLGLAVIGVWRLVAVDPPRASTSITAHPTRGGGNLAVGGTF